MGVAISAVAGGLLAVAAIFGVVGSLSAAPAPVTTPYMTYGTS